MNDIKISQWRYIGAFEEFPKDPKEYDVILNLSDNNTYIFFDSWQILKQNSDTLLDRLLEAIRKANDCPLKKQLENIIEEYYKDIK